MESRSLKELPQEVRACLWSYDIEHFDLALPDNRTRLIRNVLDRGTLAAVTWLRTHFVEEEIIEAIRTSSASEWGKKSLALWSLVFHVYPTRAGRFA
jgi:hypothetical protein